MCVGVLRLHDGRFLWEQAAWCSVSEVCLYMRLVVIQVENVCDTALFVILSMLVCVFACVFVSTYMCVNTNMCVCAYVCVYVCAYMHVLVQVLMYIHVNVNATTLSVSGVQSWKVPHLA